MRQKSPTIAMRAWVWGAMLLVASTLVGVWHAQTDPLRIAGEGDVGISAVGFAGRDSLPMEAIERTLAEAGCPGWMVLASEGPEALGPEVVPEEVRQTANQEAVSPPQGGQKKGTPNQKKTPSQRGTPIPLPQPEGPFEKMAAEKGTAIQMSGQFEVPTPAETKLGVPRVWYPTPIQVAANPTGEPQLVPSQRDDPDDLLDGEPDLLWGHPSSLRGDPDEVAQEREDATPDSAADYDETPVKLPIVDVPETDAPKMGGPEQGPEMGGPRGETLPPASWLPGVGGQEIQNPHAPIKQDSPRVSDPADSVPEAMPEQPQQHVPQQPLFGPPTAAPSGATAPHSVRSDVPQDMRTHCEFIADEMYPSAFTCAKCHENIFEEWAVSSHAYASLSPMFHKFEQKINDLSQGTIGYFCYRCHSPVGTSLGISRAEPMWNVPQVVREGVTCVACHRVNQRYGKVNGERRIEPGTVYDPVYGSIGGNGVAEVIARKDHYKVKTSPHEKGPGQDIHVAGVHFEQLSKPEFCVSCHQVAVQPGIKLEVVWEQYRASPACKKGISCQDCHMGRIPGVPSGYDTAPAAVVNGKEVNPHRKHANHTFFGPGYSIAHPGVFPHNKDALRWSVKDWLEFDWRAGWGSEEFERMVEEGRVRAHFPPVWAEVDDRMDAREVLEDNLVKLEGKRQSRIQVLENGSHVDGPFFDKPPRAGNDLRFHYVMVNTNEGHNLPSGSLGAQPQIWANVVLIGPGGQRLWESGYTDRWGDVADIHSEDVQNKRIPFDSQLFNLQTMFLITGANGTDREFFLPLNIDVDQLPFLRPGAQPISVINHPPFIRMEGRSLPPLGSRRIPYRVPAELVREPGCYRVSFRLRSRANPIYFMKFCDSTLEMQRSMNENMVDFHESSLEFHVR